MISMSFIKFVGSLREDIPFKETDPHLKRFIDKIILKIIHLK